MNPFFSQIVTQQSLKKRKSAARQNYTPYKRAKDYREFKIAVGGSFKDAVFIILGIASASFGLESFLLPNKFIDGGATGISLLVAELSSLPLFLLLIIINAPFLLLGWKVVSKSFALKATLAIVGLAVVVATVKFPEVTHDKLLVAVFGGFFLGAGIGLSIRGGAVLDGTEVFAIFMSRKLHTSIGDIIIVVNIIVFSAAAYFLSVETALYSMLTYLAASKTLDFVIEGIEEYTGVTIVSIHSHEIGKMITDELGRGITVYQGKRGFGTHGHTGEIDIVYAVITRLEVSKLNREIQKIDPNAFVVMNSIKDTRGGMIKKRPMNH